MQLEIVAEWEILALGQRLSVRPPPVITVTAENCSCLPRFDPPASGWKKGYRLKGVETEETTARGMLLPDTVQVRDRQTGTVLKRGCDYEFDPDWGTLGRLDGGRIAEHQPVAIAYRHALSRLDSIVRSADGQCHLRAGTPHVTMPAPAALGSGETRLANVWVPGRLAALTADNLFPILETAYPEPGRSDPVPAATQTPRTHAKLVAGEPVKILAWGDSVTEATYLARPDRDRWQNQFVRRLGERYPRARLELVTEGWGGHNTRTYLAEPPGSIHNYREKVLAPAPDLVITEFVNDAAFTVEETAARYVSILSEFRGIGAEWIILTPHYILPDWMGLTRQREIDDDPRPYVRFVRQFARDNRLGLADAAARWGRLWRQGIPYMTLMTNAINHPNPAGMKLFADALLELF